MYTFQVQIVPSLDQLEVKERLDDGCTPCIPSYDSSGLPFSCPFLESACHSYGDIETSPISVFHRFHLPLNASNRSLMKESILKVKKCYLSHPETASEFRVDTSQLDHPFFGKLDPQDEADDEVFTLSSLSSSGTTCLKTSVVPSLSASIRTDSMYLAPSPSDKIAFKALQVFSPFFLLIYFFFFRVQSNKGVVLSSSLWQSFLFMDIFFWLNTFIH